MKKYVDGKIVDMTAEEVAALKTETVKAQLQERIRPLTAEEVTTLLLRQSVNALEVDDNTALRMLAFYPEWAVNTDYTAGYKVQRGGRLWRALQTHTAQTGWEPENATSLWEQICETHSGAADDPVPYEGSMTLEEGLYYVQDYVIYRCTRDTGGPVYNPLCELAGLYVEAV